jgi:hypothetical protein
MTKWSYYFSGILYGIFEKDEEEISYKWLDPLTSHFCGFSELDEEKSKSLLLWANLDVLRALNNVEKYEHAFIERESAVKTEFGDFYSQREPGLYVQRNTIAPTDLLFKDGKLAAFICPARESCAILVRDGYEKDTVLSRWQEYPGGKAGYPVRFAGTFSVKTRDNIRLATDVYLPEGAREKLPAILVRTC